MIQLQKRFAQALRANPRRKKQKIRRLRTALYVAMFAAIDGDDELANSHITRAEESLGLRHGYIKGGPHMARDIASALGRTTAEDLRAVIEYCEGLLNGISEGPNNTADLIISRTQSD